jgi:hypothetical protein
LDETWKYFELIFKEMHPVRDILYLAQELKAELERYPKFVESAYVNDLYIYSIVVNEKIKRFNIKFHDADVENIILVINASSRKEYDRVLYKKTNIDRDLLLRSLIYLHDFKSLN